MVSIKRPGRLPKKFVLFPPGAIIARSPGGCGFTSASGYCPEHFRRVRLLCRWVLWFLALAPFAAGARPHSRQDLILDRMARQERQLAARMRELRPRIEIYLQTYPARPSAARPNGDDYYLGRLRYGHHFQLRSFLPRPYPTWRKWLGPVTDLLSRPIEREWQYSFLPNGFVRMLFPDPRHFDRLHYRFEFIRRVYLGHVSCYVFNVAPRRAAASGGFMGRIWVTRRHDILVRFNGVFWGGGWTRQYLHFDSWRVDAGVHGWLPAYVYSEENGRQYGLHRVLRFCAQMRLWGYHLRHAGGRQSFTHIRVEGPQIKDPPPRVQIRSPERSQLLWQRQAENNVLRRLERAGLMAPRGPVNHVLDTVANNLIVSNRLQIYPPVRCRVLLTTPLESLAIGHTIVLSRGLIDTLPSEADLAAMLAHELARIVLRQSLNPDYGFTDRMMVPDALLLGALDLRHHAAANAAANRRAWRLLAASPYAPQLPQVARYLRRLAEFSPRLPRLLQPLLADPMVVHRRLMQLVRLAKLKAPAAAPASAPPAVRAVLPLGSRIAINPWNDQIVFENHRPLPASALRRRLDFALTPLFPVLSRPLQKIAGKSSGEEHLQP